MYSELFRLLPGNFVVKVLQAIALLAVVVSFLFFIAFPFVETLLPEEPSVNG